MALFKVIHNILNNSNVINYVPNTLLQNSKFL